MSTLWKTVGTTVQWTKKWISFVWKTAWEQKKLILQTLKKIPSEWAELVKKWVTKIKWKTTWKDDIIKKLKLWEEKGVVWKKVVDIPKEEKTITEAITEPIVDVFREQNTKVLAWRAIAPRTLWKSNFQKIRR